MKLNQLYNQGAMKMISHQLNTDTCCWQAENQQAIASVMAKQLPLSPSPAWPDLSLHMGKRLEGV